MCKRICQIIKLKPTAEEEYKAIHAAVWPGVLAALERAHITDYSIHHYPPLQLLIATFKYTGSDYEGDMKKVGEDPETRRWWAVTDGMQESFVEGAQGSGKDIPWWTVSSFKPLKWFHLAPGNRSCKRYLDLMGKHDANPTYDGFPVSNFKHISNYIREMLSGWSRL